jgi:hypothetical protein
MMSTGKYQEAMARVTAGREEIWLDEPADLAAIKARQGAMKQNLTTLMFADKDTHSIMKYLHTLRDAAGEGVDLKALKALAIKQIKYDQTRFENYYLSNGTAGVFKAAADGVQAAGDADEFRALIGELLLYTMRLNHWVDISIPWPKLVESQR